MRVDKNGKAGVDEWNRVICCDLQKLYFLLLSLLFTLCHYFSFCKKNKKKLFTFGENMNMYSLLMGGYIYR